METKINKKGQQATGGLDFLWRAGSLIVVSVIVFGFLLLIVGNIQDSTGAVTAFDNASQAALSNGSDAVSTITGQYGTIAIVVVAVVLVSLAALLIVQVRRSF